MKDGHSKTRGTRNRESGASKNQKTKDRQPTVGRRRTHGKAKRSHSSGTRVVDRRRNVSADPSRKSNTMGQGGPPSARDVTHTSKRKSRTTHPTQSISKPTPNRQSSATPQITFVGSNTVERSGEALRSIQESFLQPEMDEEGSRGFVFGVSDKASVRPVGMASQVPFFSHADHVANKNTTEYGREPHGNARSVGDSDVNIHQEEDDDVAFSERSGLSHGADDASTLHSAGGGFSPRQQRIPVDTMASGPAPPLRTMGRR